MSGTHHIVLVHSPLTTSDVWGDLAAHLCDRGCTVTVTEVRDDDPPYASRFVAHVAQQLQLAAPDDHVVLIGHGAAGPLLPQIGFARQAVGRPVRGYVFVDALLPRTVGPSSLMDLIAASDPERAEGLTTRLAKNGMFPPVDDTELVGAVPDPDVRAALLADLRPRGLDFFTEALPSPIDWPDAPCGFVQLSDTFATEARSAAQRGWTVSSVEAHHFWAVSDPDGLARALGDVLASWDDGG